MIKNIIAGIAFTLCLSISTTETVISSDMEKYRTCNGTYHNYLLIETNDGNLWQLSDEQAKINPYLKWDKKHKCYIPKFRDGQKVAVKFDTKGTQSELDDVIVWVR